MEIARWHRDRDPIGPAHARYERKNLKSGRHAKRVGTVLQCFAFIECNRPWIWSLFRAAGNLGLTRNEASPDGLSNYLEVAEIVLEGPEQPLLWSFFFWVLECGSYLRWCLFGDKTKIALPLKDSLGLRQLIIRPSGWQMDG